MSCKILVAGPTSTVDKHWILQRRDLGSTSDKVQVIFQSCSWILLLPRIAYWLMQTFGQKWWMHWTKGLIPKPEQIGSCNLCGRCYISNKHQFFVTQQLTIVQIVWYRCPVKECLPFPTLSTNIWKHGIPMPFETSSDTIPKPKPLINYLNNAH